MAIPQSFLDELNERTDIVDVIGRYVTLKKGGANLLGLCPFHEEKSPSFTVSPSKQFFHCFGCGKHGNAIGFLMEYAGMGFIDAVKELAQQAGLPVPQDDITPAQAAERQQRKAQQKSLTDINAQAAAAYKELLKKDADAILYLKGRGVTGQIAARFQLGWAPRGEHTLASVFPDYADPMLEDAGLVIYKEETGRRYDRFRERLMFPIRNVRGETIGFGGRILGQGQPKYLNSPETPVFHKGRELYGLFEARQAIRSKGYALVCEGYMDVVALAQWGFANAVATLGTACTEQHVQLLFRHTDQIVFAFDGDNAGRKAAAKALECALPFAGDTRSVRFLFLPKEHDPDSFIRERGETAFAEQVELAVPLSQYLLQVAAQDCQLATAEGRARMAHQARPLWERLPESALKLQMLSEIARVAQMPRDELQGLWQAMAQDPRNAPRRPRPAPAAMPAEPADAPAGDWTIEAMAAGNWNEPADLPAMPMDDFHAADGAPWAPPPDTVADYRVPTPSYEERPRYAASRHSGGERGFSPYSGARPAPRAPVRQHVQRREEHAACILLAHMSLLETLTEQDLMLLCRLPEPDGRLFTWIDDHYQNHGVQDWASIRPILEQAGPPAWHRLVPRIEEIAQQPVAHYREELQSALRLIMIRRLNLEIEEVTRNYDTDSQAAAKLLQLNRHLARLK
ncbi:hypothetical protein AAV94_13365 [Lampropedia cohaerens]|uniref:DNA primase n=1 Tax=Lampropedia cohaerens TaxID=1610491 RepID=A0A0U1PWX9_9BURK|nr:DNA primase [Lampropedia cohaerens]KKW67029.1 hypothetical protein AAV94_13365 [Lampropedia cohaerens]